MDRVPMWPAKVVKFLQLVVAFGFQKYVVLDILHRDLVSRKSSEVMCDPFPKFQYFRGL